MTGLSSAHAQGFERLTTRLSELEGLGLAERVGFEPTVRLPVRLISSQVHSTTLPPLRGLYERDAEGTTQTSSQAVKPISLARSTPAIASLPFWPQV